MEMKTGGDAQVVLLSGSRPRIVINSSERNPEKKKKLSERSGQPVVTPKMPAKVFTCRFALQSVL